MKAFRSLGIVFLVLCGLSSSGFSRERFSAGINFTLGIPQNEFNENINTTGLGGSGYFSFRLPKSPLSIGTSFSVLVYGSETREEFLNAAIPEVIVDVKTHNYILLCNLFLRVQPHQGQFRPYAEGLIGFNYLWTETGIYDQSGPSFDEIASSVNLDDFSLNYGLGGGLMMQVYQRQNSAFAVFIDLGVRYLKGGKAEYLREGDIVQLNGEVIYNVSYSNTDLITAHIGVAFTF
ncbi:MAG: hypothetical protein JXB23_10440 [Candidatus Aminicenantes bacterium]|nr:hypothetical protein [Candidatus Aminicenantes bacterium]